MVQTHGQIQAEQGPEGHGPPPPPPENQRGRGRGAELPNPNGELPIEPPPPPARGRGRGRGQGRGGAPPEQPPPPPPALNNDEEEPFRGIDEQIPDSDPDAEQEHRYPPSHLDPGSHAPTTASQFQDRLDNRPPEGMLHSTVLHYYPQRHKLPPAQTPYGSVATHPTIQLSHHPPIASSLPTDGIIATCQALLPPARPVQN